MANLTALAVARERALEAPGATITALRAYGSTQTHNCVHKSLRLLGLGGLTTIEADGHFRVPAEKLSEKIKAGGAAGHTPFCIVANAGTVNTGAIDPLKELTELAKKENVWLHVDGAFGALARLSPTHKDALEPIADGDSVAITNHRTRKEDLDLLVATLIAPPPAPSTRKNRRTTNPR